MRKSRSRRKNERPQSSSGQVSAPGAERTEMTTSPTNVESNTALRKRNVTPEEAALTAKNYRLAKELSELRVRHRDETKTVTRLSMENMNLAARCRQAMQHVEILKKELVMHQQKSVQQVMEPLDLRGNMNNKGSLAHGKEDVSEMEGDLFRRESVSPKPSLHLALTDGLEGTRPATRTDEVDESMASSHAKAHSAINPGRLDENNQDPGDIPMLPIGPLGGNGISESESTTGDVTFGELKSSDFFNPLYENSLPATPERGNMTPLDESISSEAPINDNFKAFEGRHVESADDMSTGENTSFDAFEASFQTTFPSSFTASDSSSFANDAFNMNDFADPFFVDSSPLENQGIEFRDTMDPLINGTRNGDTVDNDDSGTSSRMLERKGRGKSPPPPQFGIRSRSRSRSTSRSRNPKMNEEPTGSTPHHSVTPFSTSTTSKSFDESSEDNHVGTNNGTKQRSLESEPLTEIHPSQDQEHSPTLVLKRLHQRRAREKAGSSEFTNNGTSRGISLSEEIRKLDAMAGGSSSGEIPLISTKPLQTKRRSSKPQQVSSTTSTVEQRRGNLIYSKKENVDILGNLKAGHNSNSKTSQSSPVNQAKANGRNGKGRPIKDTMERRHELVPTVQS